MGLTSNGRIVHLPNPTDVNVDAVMNGFDTVTGATTIPDSVVAERIPGVNTCKHTVGARRDVTLCRTQNPKGYVIPSDSVSFIFRRNLRCEARDVVCSIWSVTSWLSDGGFPTIVRLRERRVDWVEFVVIKGVVDTDFLTVWRSDGDLLQRDNLGGRNGVGCPIPVWLAKICGGLIP
jgi:hypothetical protein